MKKLSQAIQYNGEAVMITDIRGSIEYINPAFTKITGYTSDDVLGKNPRILKSDAQDPLFYKELWATVSCGQIWHGTLIDKKKDGSYFPALMTVSPIKNQEGVVTHYVSTQKDMTDHETLEQQLRQSQKIESIGTLVGGIAHDFNNMLAAIQGNIYLAQTETEDSDAINKRLAIIDSISDRAANMVKQLLTFARKDPVKMERFSLNSFMEQGYQLAQTMIPEDIEHITDYCSEELFVEGDSTQLQQVLMNLANNACHAVSDVKNPQVTCSIRPFTANESFMNKYPILHSNQCAQITVRDNGCGISKENMDKIIEPFFTTKDVGEGTGLGLSMVYGSVQSHGGVFEVESDVGKGTACHVYLPLVEKLNDQLVTHKTRTSALGNGETILLVDDKKELLKITSEVLKKLNYIVLTASDGEEALKLYHSKRSVISLVFTDVVMPKMGGFELMANIWKANADVPAIFATGYDKRANELPSDKEHQSRIITKPYSAVETSHIIRTLLS